MEYTKRARIFTGTGCNSRCRFCYYYLTGLRDFWPKRTIMRELKISKRAGMHSIDFSGGEPTAHPNFLEFVQKSYDMGFKTIGLLTNGIRMGSGNGYTEKIVEAGINDCLFSLHGYDVAEHDYITQIKGSFEKLIAAIGICKDCGVKFRINCTVTRINYKNLVKHADLYNKLEPLQVNFILFNPFETASALSDAYSVRYSEANKYIKKAIDILDGYIRHINVRYIPFCFMNGYEHYVCNYPQKIFDTFEWSQRMLIRLPSTRITPLWKYYGYLCLGCLKTRVKPRISKEYLEDVCIQMRMCDYEKCDACVDCSCRKICQGPEKSYMKIFGGNELKPFTGYDITDPMEFKFAAKVFSSLKL